MELVAHLEARLPDGVGFDGYGVYGWHVDHIIPCCKFDLGREDHRHLCFNYNNLRPLGWKENTLRGDRLLPAEVDSLPAWFVERCRSGGVAI